MNHEELKLVLQEGENYFTEFKEGISGLDKDYVTFRQSYEYLNFVSEKTPQKTPQKILTGLEIKILNEIINNPHTSRREIAEILKLNQDTVKEYLERLKKKKVIRRVGPAKGSYWEVVEEVNGK